MSGTIPFGEQVLAEANRLREKGLDANQIAAILCKSDPQGKNYGIGILLGGDGKPLATSPTLKAYLEKEIQESAQGTYLNSDSLKKEMLEAVLKWQGVPDALWANFQLLLPSDAGTGAVQTAIQVATLLPEGSSLTTLSVEELGWPAYKAIASAARLRFQEFPTDGVAKGPGVLPVYQAGPLNTTGKVPLSDVVLSRVKEARAMGVPVILDRAYSGFEFARRLNKDSYAKIMQESFGAQVQPFLEAGLPVAIAISPTKAFVSFSLRPCGMLLVFQPEKTQTQAIAPKLSGVIRARGSSFEHPVTRAFVKAMVHDRATLEEEHAQALRRTADAEQLWQTLAKGTAIQDLFSDSFAGLFRNPRVRPEAPGEIYGAHLYPVFAEGRCRLNVTGIPSDLGEAKSQVAFFSKHCYF
jgi:hypothetical protein